MMADGADMKALHKHAEAEHEEIQEANDAYKVPNAREVQERVALDELGLGDGEEALQYALMMSMEQPQAPDPDELVFGGGKIGGSSSTSRRPSGQGGAIAASRRQSSRPDGADDHEYDSSVADQHEALCGEDGAADGGYGSEEEALRAVEEFKRNEEREMREVMALIEQAEAKHGS